MLALATRAAATSQWAAQAKKARHAYPGKAETASNLRMPWRHAKPARGEASARPQETREEIRGAAGGVVEVDVGAPAKRAPGGPS